MTCSVKVWRIWITTSSCKWLATLGLCVLRGERNDKGCWEMHMYSALRAAVRPSLRWTKVTGLSLTFPTLHWLLHPATQCPAHVAASPGTAGERKAPRSCSQLPYRHDELLHAVGRHAVEVGEVQLEVDLVVEHVLAQGAAEHGLHRVLRHGVHPQPVDIGVAVLAVGTLVHLWGTHSHPSGWIFCSHRNCVRPKPAHPRLHSPLPPVIWNTPPPAQPLLASPAPLWSPLMFLVALQREETLSYLGRRCVWRLQENLSAPSLLGLMMLEEKAEDVIQQPDQASSQRVCVGWKSTFIYSTGFSWNTKIKVGWASGLIYQAC